jgi:hypothetical protein
LGGLFNAVAVLPSLALLPQTATSSEASSSRFSLQWRSRSHFRSFASSLLGARTLTPHDRMFVLSSYFHFHHKKGKQCCWMVTGIASKLVEVSRAPHFFFEKINSIQKGRLIPPPPPPPSLPTAPEAHSHLSKVVCHRFTSQK